MRGLQSRNLDLVKRNVKVQHVLYKDRAHRDYRLLSPIQDLHNIITTSSCMDKRVVPSFAG